MRAPWNRRWMGIMRTSLRPSLESPASDGPSACATCSGAPAPEQVAPEESPKTPESWVKEHQKELKDALAEQRRLLTAKKKELEKNDAKAKANLKKFFGSDSEETRKTILKRVDNELNLNATIAKDPSAHFQDPEESNPSRLNRFAYVHPADATHQIFIDTSFRAAATSGEDSRAGTLAHEMSHFDDIAGTRDKIYGAENALRLAKDKPADAMQNADSFEYYVEGNR